jgi:predicted nuclease of restriction endonuclease-like (RecB) superfamily
VEHRSERQFYEVEAHKAGCSVERLERQMRSFLFARLLKSRDKAGVLALANAGHEIAAPIHAVKHPYVLDLLPCPRHANWRANASRSCICRQSQTMLWSQLRLQPNS